MLVGFGPKKRKSILPKQRAYFFNGGEYMKYRASYSFINAGEIEFMVDTQVYNINNIATYRVRAVGKTIGALASVALVNDTISSYIDTTTFLTVKSVRDQQENTYTFLQTVEFDRENSRVDLATRVEYNRIELTTKTTTGLAQDMISTYFDLRSVDVNQYNINDTLFFDVFSDDTTFRIPLLWLGRDKVKSIFGKVNTLVFSPVTPKVKNTFLSGDNPIKAYISDDYNRIPIKIEVQTKYGKIKVELVDYKKPLYKSIYRFK
jgi:hypothetical protein